MHSGRYFDAGAQNGWHSLAGQSFAKQSLQSLEARELHGKSRIGCHSLLDAEHTSGIELTVQVGVYQ